MGTSTSAFEQVFDSFRKSAETALQAQQEMVRQWTSRLPVAGAVPTPADWMERVQQMRKEWALAATALLQRHRDTLDANYRAGINALEEAVRVGDARDPEEYRRKLQELWRRSFDCLHEMSLSQLRDLQSAFDKWMDLAKKPT